MPCPASGILAQLIEAIKTVGVPAAITFIVLWRVEGKLDRVIMLLERAFGGVVKPIRP